LLSKLHFYGNQRITAELFRSYLTEKRQKVRTESSKNIQNSFSSRVTIKHGYPVGLFLWFLILIIYINDLPPTINILQQHIIFAHATSVIISTKSSEDFCRMSNIVLSMSKWFAANRLVLNLDTTNILKFITNNSQQYPLTQQDIPGEQSVTL
jgi:hypothetical protein